MAVLCGTCAWSDHAMFYPKTVRPADRLAYYARFFPLVEVDSTYYHIPRPEIVQAWVHNVSQDFVFDVKAYRSLTRHDRGELDETALRQDFDAFERAVSVIAQANQLGQLLFQFPPWFVCTPENRFYIEERVFKRFPGYRIGIEFRHRSWWLEDQSAATLSWLRQLQAVNVVCDEPQAGMGTIPFVSDVTNPALVVFRLHGRNADTWYEQGLTSSQQRFDYKYSTDELQLFLDAVQSWEHQAAEVHILMNNNQADYAIQNALDWLSLLGQPVPNRVTGSSRQTLLFGEDVFRGED